MSEAEFCVTCATRLSISATSNVAIRCNVKSPQEEQRPDQTPRAMRTRRETVEHPFGTNEGNGWVRRT